MATWNFQSLHCQLLTTCHQLLDDVCLIVIFNFLTMTHKSMLPFHTNTTEHHDATVLQWCKMSKSVTSSFHTTATVVAMHKVSKKIVACRAKNVFTKVNSVKLLIPEPYTLHNAQHIKYHWPWHQNSTLAPCMVHNANDVVWHATLCHLKQCHVMMKNAMACCYNCRTKKNTTAQYKMQLTMPHNTEKHFHMM